MQYRYVKISVVVFIVCSSVFLQATKRKKTEIGDSQTEQSVDVDNQEILQRPRNIPDNFISDEILLVRETIQDVRNKYFCLLKQIEQLFSFSNSLAFEFLLKKQELVLRNGNNENDLNRVTSVHSYMYTFTNTCRAYKQKIQQLLMELASAIITNNVSTISDPFIEYILSNYQQLEQEIMLAQQEATCLSSGEDIACIRAL